MLVEKSLTPFRVPGELKYLSATRASINAGQASKKTVLSSPSPVSPPIFTQTASRRLNVLVRGELQKHEISVAHPAWLNGQAVPRLIVTARYSGQDAFGSSRLLADLDLAARRAGALQRQLVGRDESVKWPAPLRTHTGGLRLLDARVGSFDVVLTVWGSLVAIAGSSPVSVAGLMALAWDVGRGSLRLADRWVGTALTLEQSDQPSIKPPEAGTPWGIQHTKALAPVMRDVVSSGQGFELFLDEKDRTIRLTVPPVDQVESDLH
jgi:hypothetical protein